MKLLFISAERFPPFRVDITTLFGREFVKRGHKITWLMQAETKCDKAYKVKWRDCDIFVGATNLNGNFFSRLQKRWYDFTNDCRIVSISKNETFDCIIIRDKFLIGLLALLVAKIRKTGFVFWLSYPFPEANLHEAHSGTARYPAFYWLMGHFKGFLLYKILLPRAKHIFVQSKQMKFDISRHGIKATTMTAVPMGVDINSMPCINQYQTPEKKRPAEDIKRIMYLGTLKRLRHLDFLVRVLNLVIKEYPKVQLCFIGGGEEEIDEDILWDEGKRLGVTQQMEISGMLPMPAAWNRIMQADLCLSPFFPTFILNSTSPTKLIEYMALGKAVIANDHPEQKEVLNKSGAGLCVPYDEIPFANAIITLLNDPERTRIMGEQGREYVVKHRTYSKIADMVEEQFIKILTH